MGGRSVHVIKRGVADQEVAETFSGGVFFIFSSEALFFGNSFLFFQKASMRKGS